MPVTIDREKCDACAKCIDSCATDALKKGNCPDTGKEVVEVVDENCADCGICITECPNEAIVQA